MKTFSKEKLILEHYVKTAEEVMWDSRNFDAERH